MQISDFHSAFCQIIETNNNTERATWTAQRETPDNKGRQVMRKASWMVLLIIGMLMSSAGFADEFGDAGDDPKPSTNRTLSDLLAESAYEPRWQLYHPVDATPYSDRWLESMADIEFQDNSVLGRVSKLRNLSLLTLAESRQSLLFLGVNDDGLVGLHFIALSKNADERYLSVARMPYLKKREPRSQVD
jgi:hypothetical protein